MFTKMIVDSDAFLDMPTSTQALYFHLGMRADDEGFINNPKKVQRMVGANEDDLRLLITKKFIIAFDTGVIVIKHWKMHNSLRADRVKKTVYGNELAQLEIKENGSYTLKNKPPEIMVDNSPSNVRQLSDKCPHSIDKIRLDKIRLDKDSIGEYEGDKSPTPISKSSQEIIEYLNLILGTNFKPTTKATQSLIKTRLSENYTIDDFKQVIDIKNAEWSGDPKMSKFLRPETLFGNKFESYLNQKPPDKFASLPQNLQNAFRLAEEEKSKPRELNIFEQIRNEQDFNDDSSSLSEF